MSAVWCQSRVKGPVAHYRTFYCISSMTTGCIVWNAHNTELGEEALLIYSVSTKKTAPLSIMVQYSKYLEDVIEISTTEFSI